MSTHFDIRGAVALVTGANRGIGKAFVQELLAGGVARVYAAARDPESLAALTAEDNRVVPVRLDVADDESVQAAAARLPNVTLVINNAGVSLGARLIGADDLAAARQEMEVNYFGVLRMSRAFAPMLAANGGGALVNVLSILARITSPTAGSYSASKAAAFALTQGVRAELRAQNTLVVGVMPGYVDTDMVARLDVPKITPTDVVHATLDALVSGKEDVYPGETAKPDRSRPAARPQSRRAAVRPVGRGVIDRWGE